MRIWHETLTSQLCRQHLLGEWREGLGCYEIIVQGKKGYLNHPQTQVYIHSPYKLWKHLKAIRTEMLRRGYNPKPLPPCKRQDGKLNEWQDLKTQITVLRSKGCECKIKF